MGRQNWRPRKRCGTIAAIDGRNGGHGIEGRPQTAANGNEVLFAETLVNVDTTGDVVIAGGLLRNYVDVGLDDTSLNVIGVDKNILDMLDTLTSIGSVRQSRTIIGYVGLKDDTSFLVRLSPFGEEL